VLGGLEWVIGIARDEIQSTNGQTDKSSASAFGSDAQNRPNLKRSTLAFLEALARAIRRLETEFVLGGRAYLYRDDLTWQQPHPSFV